MSTPEPERDYLSEARRIAAGETALLATREHLIALLAENEAVSAEPARLRRLLAPILESLGVCTEFDHHGYCQTHFLEPRDECCVRLARATMEGKA